MAVTAIWDIKGRVDKVISYATNPQKTDASALQYAADFHAIEKVVEYSADEMKTEKCCYVSGINCDPDQAAHQFVRSKKHWGKEGGIVAFHGYQSFRAGEVDAGTAHQIGVALAKELWGDRFEVVVATHLNTDHYHNHFVLNSVSFCDGYKYNDCRESYQKMRDVSDRLCKEYQLSVIWNPQGKRKSYPEWKAEQHGLPTYRGTVKADIDRAIMASTTMRDFYKVMEQQGYRLKLYKKNGEEREHPVAIPPGAKKGVRMDGLGADYTLDGIKERILQNLRRQVPFPEAVNRNVGRYRLRGSFRKYPKAKGLRALYLYYCYKLGIIVKRPASVKQVPASLREDMLKMNRIIAQTRFLGANKIETLEELATKKAEAENRICISTDQRKERRNALKRAIRRGDKEAAEEIKAQISALSAEIKLCQKEVKLCSEIAGRSGITKENLEQIVQQQNAERKEKNDHEYRGRSSGTNRSNVTQWR